MGRIIAQGAEAVISEKDGSISKERIKKGYRIPQLDEKIRSERTSREEGLIIRARRAGVSVPQILEKAKFELIMEYVKGDRVKEVFNTLSKTDREEVCRHIGESVRKLHENEIMHGDLTTSNMIWNGKLVIIDFGLGKVTKRIEDYAIDLFLLKESFKAAHFMWLNEAWEAILKAYKHDFANSSQILTQMLKIDKRRRYRGE